MVSSHHRNACCGLSEVYGFEVYNTVRYEEDSLKDVVSQDRNYAFQFLTLKVDQNKKFSKAVIRCGFKLVGKCINTNTGNLLFMYVRPRVAEKKAKPAKKKTVKKGTWVY